uniref:C2H2-type domain-containing protein n=1 Tax=Labrus bergylta TaxID=56723 RepID=A0A3Q3M179_9LABR
MSKVQMMRAFVNQRLTDAAEEIFDLFEGTIAEYEEQLRRSKEENERQHKLLDAMLMVKKEEVPSEQQERSNEEPPHIKEEQEEFWSSQEGEQLQGSEEADISMVTFFRVRVKTEEEDDGENPQTSQLNENQTEKGRDIEHLKRESDGEDCEGSEPDRDFNPDSHLQTVSPDKTSHFSGSDTDDSGDWEEREEPQEGLNPLQNKDVPVSDMNCNTGNTSVSSSECGTSFGQKEQLQENKEINTGEKPFSCSVCGKTYTKKINLHQHMLRHSVEKPFSCSVCKRSFIWRGEMVTHMRVHTGEKPFSCSVCGKTFSRQGCLRTHSLVHTEEKPFGCLVCGKRFVRSGDFKRHSVVHTGEKPFSCSVCGKSFSRHALLRQHSFVHTEEKRFNWDENNTRAVTRSNSTKSRRNENNRKKQTIIKRPRTGHRGLNKTVHLSINQIRKYQSGLFDSSCNFWN